MENFNNAIDSFKGMIFVMTESDKLIPMFEIETALDFALDQEGLETKNLTKEQLDKVKLVTESFSDYILIDNE